MLYGHWSRGFKSGGFNGRPQGQVNAIQPFDPEEVDSFEGGLKSRLFNDRVQANLAAFYMDYKNIQSVIQQAGTFIITNAAAEIWGFEAEIQARLTSELTLSLGLGYTDSEYKDVPVGLPYRNGNQLPLSPEWTVNAAAEYVVPLDTMGDVSLRGEWIYTGDQFFQATNFPAERQGGYSLFNFRVTWSNADDTVSVAGYVQNAFDERYFTFGQDASAGFGPSYVFVGDPREWGLTVSYRF
jgi:iron complex outermembrane receptor protein